MDPRIARLLDKDAIQDVVYRYCRGIDRRDLEAVRACYHPDAHDHHGSFSGTVDAYIEWVDRLLARYELAMHFIGNVLIEFGEQEHVAAAESYGISLHRSKEPAPHLNLATGFRFLDRFECRDGVWKIAERTAVSEWSIRLPPEIWWEYPESLLTGQRDRSDALYTLLSQLQPKV